MLRSYDHPPMLQRVSNNNNLVNSLIRLCIRLKLDGGMLSAIIQKELDDWAVRLERLAQIHFGQVKPEHFHTATGYNEPYCMTMSK